MFGIRFTPLIRKSVQMCTNHVYLPSFQFSLVNKQTTNILLRTSLLPSNIIIKNLLEILQKMNEEINQEGDKDVKNLSLINQGTLRMSHINVC